jgi:hypothetical protein
MDNLKSESNVKHGEVAVLCYIFHAMSGRKCLIQWMKVISVPPRSIDLDTILLLSFGYMFDSMDESICFHH